MLFSERLLESRARAADYIASRQCANGGFCAYRSIYLEQANLADTWHALASLQLLGLAPPEVARLLHWLDGFAPATLNPDELYYWAFVQRQLQPDWWPGASTREYIAQMALCVPDLNAEDTAVLAHLLRTLKLQCVFGELTAQPELVSGLRRSYQGGYGAKPNLQATALAIELLNMLNEPDHSQGTRDFVDTLQRRPYGFDNTLDSSYCRLDILYSGVRCCQWLGIPIKYGSDILATVVAAQRGDGAFADVPGALPTLESHFTALALIRALADPAK